MTETYRCGCGQPWITLVAANRVSASTEDWRLCPECDGHAARTAMTPRRRTDTEETA